MLKIDSHTYNIPVQSLKRKADFLDKYAERTEDGELHRELIGVYFNYQLSLGSCEKEEYDRLWQKLTEPVEFHNVTVPYGQDQYSFIAYFSNVSDSLLRTTKDANYWTGLTVNFTAKSPARR